MSRRTLTVDEALHDYVIEHGVREHPELTALREATRTHPRAGMQISPEQGQLMRLLVQMLREFLARGGATPSQYAQRKED